ncbi:MAG: glutamate-cysteine ligase family protein [Acidobacteriota bacterium]
MGEQNTGSGQLDGDARRAFMRGLLDDLEALGRMIDAGMIESGVRRIGAEQELFLVDRSWRPAPRALELLDALDDPHFTTELALFNLEANLDPLELTGDALARLEASLGGLVERAGRAAERLGVRCLMTGILPTLRKSDLGYDNMTPRPRYRALDRAIRRLRGGQPFEFRIRGVDELIVRHDSVMVEACNCSFQVHFQVGAQEFARLYNFAQAVAGPVLAAATNSPLLFGRRLWRETRIATFQQAVDTRSTSQHLRDLRPRVSFGRAWVERSVLELFQEDVARFRVLFGMPDRPARSTEILERGGIPTLDALRLHNGTVYRWNRACYGLTDGRPHLRIENRLFPSGPSVVDEVANAAFWFGLIGGLAETVEDIREQMSFADATQNFEAAARSGLHAQFVWRGATRPAREVICGELLPLAQRGLEARGLDAADIDRLLGIIERRVSTGRTGSQWLLDSLDAMGSHGTLGERLNALTAASVARQATGEPVAAWELAQLDEAGGWQHNYLRVEQYMSTDMFTVHEEEPIDLVANLMLWERIRHVPVEDDEHRLVGLVSYRALLRHLARHGGRGDGEPVAVREIMARDPVTVTPETRTLDAIRLMRTAKVGCLPVVKDDRLVGVVIERDFMDIASELLHERLAGDD